MRATWRILRDTRMRIRFVSKILFITISYALLMLSRVVCLLYRPITDKFFDYRVFQTFACVCPLSSMPRLCSQELPRYYIPEMLPILLQLFFMRAVRPWQIFFHRALSVLTVHSASAQQHQVGRRHSLTPARWRPTRSGSASPVCGRRC